MPGARGPPARPGFTSRCRLAGQVDRRNVRQRPPGDRWRAKSFVAVARKRDRRSQYGEQQQYQSGAAAPGAAQEAEEGILAGQLAAAPRQTLQRRGFSGCVAAALFRLESDDATCGARLEVRCPGPSGVVRSARYAVRAPTFGPLRHEAVLAVRVVPATTAEAGPGAIPPGDLVRLLVLEAVARLGAAAVRIGVASMRAPTGLRGTSVSTGRAAPGAAGRGCGLRVRGGVALRCGGRGLAAVRRRGGVAIARGRRTDGRRRKYCADGVVGPNRR